MIENPVLNADLDYELLDREWTKTKLQLYTKGAGGFLMPLLSNLNFYWSTDIPTARTNGISLHFNPHFFMKIPKETQVSVLAHEIWHVAFLHMLRRGTREPYLSNIAMDYQINNLLAREGYTFHGTDPYLDQARFGDMIWEDIYDILLQERDDIAKKLNEWGIPMLPSEVTGDDPYVIGDVEEPEEKSEMDGIVSNVLVAQQAAKMSGAGDMPGSIETILKRFVSPKLPWNILLQKWFQDRDDVIRSFRRPNRRYSTEYMPSDIEDEEGRLIHLIYYLDVSGSITQAEVVRFNSEVKYIKETYNPEKLTVVLFDTMIQKEIVFMQEDPFDEILIVGGGGTCLICVREHILQHRPTAAVIFSDMEVSPMEPLPSGVEIDTLWVAINARGVKVPFGKLIHFRD